MAPLSTTTSELSVFVMDRSAESGAGPLLKPSTHRNKNEGFPENGTLISNGKESVWPFSTLVFGGDMTSSVKEKRPSSLKVIVVETIVKTQELSYDFFETCSCLDEYITFIGVMIRSSAREKSVKRERKRNEKNEG